MWLWFLLRLAGIAKADQQLLDLLLQSGRCLDFRSRESEIHVCSQCP